MKLLSIREEAINYRKKGYSYNMISEKLGLAKSTLSDWLKEIPYRPNKKVEKRIKLNYLRIAQFKHNQRMASIKKMKELGKKELGKLNKRDLWLLGIGLYLGEGTKLQENVQLTNSDPQIIKLTIEWLKEVYGLNMENFRIAVHVYPDNSIEDAVNFWSKVTDIPKKQFSKTQVDRRTNKSHKKKRKLPYGTARLTVRANGKKEFGVNFHRRIMGSVENAINQINKRV